MKNSRVTGQPSSVTSFVVLGENAGPAKIKAIAKHKLKTLSEDEFLNLIATRKGFLDEKTKIKMEKEEKKIKEAARELELAERRADKAAAKIGGRFLNSLFCIWLTTNISSTVYQPHNYGLFDMHPRV